MSASVQLFCDMVRNRSEENRRAMRCLSIPNGMVSPAFSILRQELDSMVRVIFLLEITDVTERHRLIDSTLQGEKWRVRTPKGRWRDVTDREMVDLAQQLHGWTCSVYKFGCAFIHLSDFHNHFAENPFAKLEESEKLDILSHLRNYHFGPCHDNPGMVELMRYVPQVFNKIAGNLESYLKQLNLDKALDE